MTTREKLKRLSENLWWSWHPEVRSLFRRLNPDVFQENGRNPCAALAHANENLLDDPRFAADVDAAFQAFEQYLERPPAPDSTPSVAYFCMEYGLHESLPLYSGGLGILAGDHTKAASDLGLPFTAVGLLLREGYFRQYFDEEGRQQAEHLSLDMKQAPLHLVTNEDGTPLTVSVFIGDTPVELQAWEARIGRNSLYLLDSDHDGNPTELRALTRRLYQGGNEIRIQQEIILGIGGVRLLRALGHEPELFHLNEGHSAFLTLELLRECLSLGQTLETAETTVREKCVFTTHTPVPAGHDHFAPPLVTSKLAHFREHLGLSEKQLLSYGRVHTEEGTQKPFTMTVLGLKLSHQANGVSRLNGHVARQQWHDLYPDRAVDEVPIAHITNGIHLPTWTAPHARAFLNERLGDWLQEGHRPSFWHQIDSISDEDLWRYRCTLRGLLVNFVQNYARRQSLPQAPQLDPDALTIGFARRFATYKRAPLLFSDLERAEALFSNEERPIQVLFAGKAHPADEGGKEYIKRIYDISQRASFKGRLIFLENYNMHIGRMLVSGCDVWLNNPRRPYEASGTSGQKVSVHGGLNLSVLDGWWPEGYNGKNGWAIGPQPTGSLNHTNAEQQDREDADALYETLEQQVIPAFYERDADGLPHAWIARMRAAIRTLPAAFSAARMVSDYVENVYRSPRAVRS